MIARAAAGRVGQWFAVSIIWINHACICLTEMACTIMVLLQSVEPVGQTMVVNIPMILPF